MLFSDIRGFTAMSESMAPEALVKFINGYLSPMTRIVFDEGGTLDKYIGDALMAFWGAPVPQEDHALRACRTALRFLEELEQLRRRWRAEGLPEIDIGVGINTGPMVVGNMGSDVRFDYTVMGDAVNMASRLEGANKLFHTSIMVSEDTWNRVASQATGRRLGSLRLRGRTRAGAGVGAAARSGLPTAEEQATIAQFEAAVDAPRRPAGVGGRGRVPGGARRPSGRPRRPEVPLRGPDARRCRAASSRPVARTQEVAPPGGS